MFEHSAEQEREKAQLWISLSCVAAFAMTLGCITLIWPLAQLFQPWTSGGPVRPAIHDPAWWYYPVHYLAHWWHETRSYFRGLFSGQAGEWLRMIWYRFASRPLETQSLEILWWTAAFAPPTIFLSWLINKCPWDLRYQAHGAARWMDNAAIQENGMFSPTGFVLGLKKTGLWPFRSYREVRFWETTSLILLAPPGTGKTVQMAYNILTDWPDFRRTLFGRKKPMDVPGPTIIFNDPKGENFKLTAGWRSRLGPVYRLAWDENNSDHWNPLGPRSMPGGARARVLRLGILMQLGRIVHPSVAPDILSRILVTIRDFANWRDRLIENPALLLAIDADEDEVKQICTEASRSVLAGTFDDVLELADIYSRRESNIDRQCAVCIPDTVEQHWRITGRAALAGFLGFMVARCERDPDRYGEPTYGKVIELMNRGSKGGAGYRSFKYNGPEEDEDGNKAPKHANVEGLGTGPKDATGGDAAEKDVVEAFLAACLEEAEQHGYPDRIKLDLEDLKRKPDKERGSVLSTAGGSINIFKNAAVRQATSTSDFSLEDLRGLPNPAYPEKPGILFRLKQAYFPIPRYLPLSVYMVVPLNMVDALSPVTGLFVDWASEGSMSQDKDWATRGGRRPIQFWLDEFWTLPPLGCIKKIPAFGRGLWVSMYLVGQSLAQIGSKFKADGANAVDELQDSVNNTIAPTQNSYKTAENISKSIGNRTVIKKSRSQARGLSLDLKQSMQHNETISFEGQPLMRPDQITSLPKLDPKKRRYGKQLIIVTGFKNTPIMADVPVWFWDRRLLKRAELPLSPRTVEPAPLFESLTPAISTAGHGAAKAGAGPGPGARPGLGESMKAYTPPAYDESTGTRVL